MAYPARPAGRPCPYGRQLYHAVHGHSLTPRGETSRGHAARKSSATPACALQVNAAIVTSVLLRILAPEAFRASPVHDLPLHPRTCHYAAGQSGCQARTQMRHPKHCATRRAKHPADCNAEHPAMQSAMHETTVRDVPTAMPGAMLRDEPTAARYEVQSAETGATGNAKRRAEPEAGTASTAEASERTRQ